MTIRPTFCDMTIQRLTRKNRVIVTVRDDGQGFQNLADAYTLFRTTSKRGQAQVAGRFNLGEKELMAAAHVGSIETTSGTVLFNSKGRETSTAKKTKKGTVVTAELSATADEANEAITMLQRLIPPVGLKYYVNGLEINGQQPDYVSNQPLTTYIQSAHGEPMRKTIRKTDIHIRRTHPDELSWINELGCPIQPINCPFSIDIRQKVPMPPERDTVADWYLQDVYAIVLSTVAADLSEDEVGQSWVTIAIENGNVSPTALTEVIRKRHGEKVVLWSSDRQANERAREAGYEVLPKSFLSAGARDAYLEVGISHAATVFGAENKPVYVDPDENMGRVAIYADRLANAFLGHGISIEFVELQKNPARADYERVKRLLRFNLLNLDKDWFQQITEDVTSTILHELAHDRDIGPFADPHGFAYINSLSDLAAKVLHTSYKGQEPTRSLLAGFLV